MIPRFQVPRNTLLWLLGSQALVIIPHLPRLPIWIVLAWFATVTWRVQIFRGVWTFPGRPSKLLVVGLCVLGLASEYSRFFGLEPMVAILVTAFLLKLLEMREKRDALILVFLGYFIAATQFLFTQGMLIALYLMLCITALTTALLGLHQTEGYRHPWRSLRRAGVLLAQSLPLMALLFIVMPRVGSLWAVPQQDSARTGMSDSMAPGDFSSLVRDEERAFRVTFETQMPPPRDLYWRGLVLSRFDGREWSQVSFGSGGLDVNWRDEERASWRDKIERSGEALDYEVILEPTHRNWLFALATPRSSTEAVGLAQDYRLLRRERIRQRLQYQVSSHRQYRIAPESLASEVRRRELALPDNANPRSREQAQQWRDEAGDDRAYIQQVLDHFSGEFSYTLNPPTLGQDSVDEFLFETRQGFCEHFASAFAVMMRAADIPARVVVGYQGGEATPANTYLEVRQSDAHAWNEVWLEGEGWTRVDPTAAVSPDRIESGLASLPEADYLRDPLEDMTLLKGLNLLRVRLEVLEYQWHRLVIGYRREQQADFLRNLLGGLDPLRLALFLGVGGTLVLAPLAFYLLLSGRGRRPPLADRIYGRFLRKLRRRGIVRRAGEGPRSLAHRVADERPELALWARRVSQAYERYRYAGDTDALPKLRRLVRREIYSQESTVYSRRR